MSTTIYATFVTANDADRAVGALLDHGVPSTAVSVLIPENHATAPAVASVPPPPPVATTSPIVATPVAPGTVIPSDIPVPDVVVPAPQTQPGTVVGMEGRPLGEQESVRFGPNEGIDTISAVNAQRGALRMETPAGEVITSPAKIATLPANTPDDVVLNDPHPHIVDMNRERPAGSTGLSTTTAADAAKGALEGTGIGLGLGILLGLATVFIPGIGFVAGAGLLAAGLAAGTGAAAGIVGGVYGYLADMGVPPDTARHLSDHVTGGGTVLSIAVSGPITEAEIMRLLQKYDAVSVQAF